MDEKAKEVKTELNRRRVLASFFVIYRLCGPWSVWLARAREGCQNRWIAKHPRSLGREETRRYANYTTHILRGDVGFDQLEARPT